MTKAERRKRNRAQSAACKTINGRSSIANQIVKAKQPAYGVWAYVPSRGLRNGRPIY